MSNFEAFSLLSKDIRICINPSKDAWIKAEELSTKDLLRFESLSQPDVRDRFIESRTALKHTLGKHLLHELDFEQKRPVHPKGFVSLSHCKGGSAAVYSANLEVGIDIESTREQILRIGDKFTNEEEKSLFQMNEQDQLQFIWGIKESLFKLYAYGNIDFKTHLKITSVHWDASNKTGWGTAWITQTCEKRPQPLQCLFQFKKIGTHYLCVATHRAPILPFYSERLFLREWTPQDAKWLTELNANPKVTLYTGDAGFTSEQDALNLILTYPNYQRDGYGRWMVCRKEDHRPIGWCGLKNNPWGIDLGFRFFEEFWGHGYGLEAARAAVLWAKNHGLSRLVGRTLSKNEGSIRILEKIGMQHFEDVSIEEFSSNHHCSTDDLLNWKGQSVKNYILDL